MRRTYRVTVKGRFADLDAAQRDYLRAQQSEHDMFAARFAREGTFLYAPELVGYQHRFEILVDDESPEDAEVLAGMRAQELAEADLSERGLQGNTVDISTVSVEGMKVRRT